MKVKGAVSGGVPTWPVGLDMAAAVEDSLEAEQLRMQVRTVTAVPGVRHGRLAVCRLRTRLLVYPNPGVEQAYLLASTVLEDCFVWSARPQPYPYHCVVQHIACQPAHTGVAVATRDTGVAC